jgi:hypothetical protein
MGWKTLSRLFALHGQVDLPQGTAPAGRNLGPTMGEPVISQHKRTARLLSLTRGRGPSAAYLTTL